MPPSPASSRPHRDVLSTTALTLLVLLSALLQASWNALIKREEDTRSATLGIMVLAALFAAISAFVRGQGLGTPAGHMFAVAAGLCEAGYLFSLSRALHYGSLGRMYAIARGGSLVALWPLTVVLLHEHPKPIALAGAGVVVFGIVVSGLSTPPPGALRPRVGTAWAIAAAFFIAGYTLFYKRALGEHAAPGALFCASMTLALAVNVVLAGERRRELRHFLRHRAIFAVLGGVLACVSFWLYLFCLARGGTGALATLRNTSVLFAQGYAFLLGEKASRAQLIACGLIMVGATLLSLR